MSYRIIRLGSGWGFALAVTPADTKPDGLTLPEGARFYRWADWKIGEHEPFQWNPLSPTGVWGYFSGHADGLGFEELPEEPFPTLDEASAWMMTCRTHAQKALHEQIAKLKNA